MILISESLQQAAAKSRHKLQSSIERRLWIVYSKDREKRQWTTINRKKLNTAIVEKFNAEITMVKSLWN